MNKPLLAAIPLMFLYPLAGFWPTFFVILVSCVFLVRRELLVFSLYLSFFNMAGAEHAPSWGGICGALLALAFHFAKAPMAARRFSGRKSLIYAAVIFILIISVSYFFVGFSAVFKPTATKSYIQQVVFVCLFLYFAWLSDKEIVYLKENISSDLPKFVVVYTAVFLFFDLIFTREGRYGGALGAQSLAFLYALLVCVYAIGEKNFKKSILVFFATIITLSRSFLVVEVVIIFLMFFLKGGNFKNKIMYSILGLAATSSAVVIVPFFSKRLNYYDEDFFGTLVGRFANYENAIAMIKSNPLFGNGVGSMVNVLEGWIPEFYEYYLSSGDTTIMHNEYLRVLTETGLVGFFAFMVFLFVLVNEKKGVPLFVLMVFLAGSLVENTLALYSGPIVVFALLISVFNRKVDGLYDTVGR